MTPQESDPVSRLIQYLGRRYVPYVNRQYRRSGTLWEGRFKASLIQSESYLLTCHRYIELNPVRAAMVSAPGEYPWSSYRVNALGQDNSFVEPHREYRALGSSDPQRCAAYRELFAGHLDPAALHQMRACLQSGTPFGNDRFREQVEKTLGRHVRYSRRGRPKRRADSNADRDPPFGPTAAKLNRPIKSKGLRPLISRPLISISDPLSHLRGPLSGLTDVLGHGK